MNRRAFFASLVVFPAVFKAAITSTGVSSWTPDPPFAQFPPTLMSGVSDDEIQDLLRHLARCDRDRKLSMIYGEHPFTAQEDSR